MPVTIDPPLFFLCPRCGPRADEFPDLLFMTTLLIFKRDLQRCHGQDAAVKALLMAKGELATRSLLDFYDRHREALHARLTA